MYVILEIPGMCCYTIINQLYTLIPTENKRELIYDNNIFTNTKPFNIDSKGTILKN